MQQERRKKREEQSSSQGTQNTKQSYLINIEITKTKMKFSENLVVFLCAFAVAQTSAFSVAPRQVVDPTAVVAPRSSTKLSMGLFDFFSDEARQEREEKKRRQVEEQERLQREIMERRKNPEMMEEYEAKVRLRRKLRLEGRDDMAERIEMYGKAEEEEE